MLRSARNASLLALFCFMLGCWGLLGSRVASAHPLQIVPVTVIIRPQKTFLTVQIRGNGADLLSATKLSPKDVSGDSFDDHGKDVIQKYVNANLKLAQGKALSGTIPPESEVSYEPDEADPTKSRFEATFRYTRDPRDASKPFLVTSNLMRDVPNAPTFLSVGGFQKQLTMGEQVKLDPADVATNLIRNVRDFMLLGIEHIFTGPDHMLFILSLLLVSTTFWSLTKTLTGFTIAHSITLILSALSVIVLPAKMVDIFVALSIIYVGLENIFLKSTKHRFFIAAAFGLVHGFGFSTALREVGLPDDGLAWCLLSFNLGVEIAQMILCAIAFPLLVIARRKFEKQEDYGGMPWIKVMHLMSWGVVAAGSYWLLDRITG